MFSYQKTLAYILHLFFISFTKSIGCVHKNINIHKTTVPFLNGTTVLIFAEQFKFGGRGSFYLDIDLFFHNL